MSAKKGSDKTTSEKFDDENMDSGNSVGFSEEFDKKEDTIVHSDKKVTSEYSELDSGLGLSECLDSLKLDDSTQYSTPSVPQGPLINIEEDEKPQEIPLPYLFQQDEDGDTKLHIAAVHGCEKTVGTLIRISPNMAWLDLPNDYGHTALHLAVMSGHAVVTRMLVRAGSSIGFRDIKGETPLHKAVAGNRFECLQALLSPVAEHPPRKLSTTLNQKNYKGQTCVHMATSAGQTDLLQTLVYFGADINAREGLAGWTALHLAARKEDQRLVQFLLQQRGCSQYVQDYAGRTPRRVTRNSRITAMFTPDDDDDSDDDMYDSDSDSESLFDKMQQMTNLVNVA